MGLDVLGIGVVGGSAVRERSTHRPAGSGTGFDEVGGLLCFCALTLNAYCGRRMAFLQTYQLDFP